MHDAERRLLDALTVTTRPNVLELSRRLAIARNTVQARLDRLQRAGVVAGYGPLLDLRALGYGVLAFMTLEVAQGQDSTTLDRLVTIPEVLEIHKVTAPGDLLCRVVAHDNEHLHDIVERVLAVPGIERTTTTLVLHSVVNRMHPSVPAAADLPVERLG